MKMSELFKRIDWSLAIAKAVAVLLAFYLGTIVTRIWHEESMWLGAMLACVSSIVVLQSDFKVSIKQAWLRILGIFIGAVFGSLYSMFFPFSVIGMVILVFWLELFCMVINVPEGGKMAAVTLVTILLATKLTSHMPPLVNGTFRFIESTIGASIGIIGTWILIKLKSIE